MCIDVLEHVVQRFTAMFSVFSYDGLLKTSRVIPFIAPQRINLTKTDKSTHIIDSTKTSMTYLPHIAEVLFGVISWKECRYFWILDCTNTWCISRHRLEEGLKQWQAKTSCISHRKRPDTSKQWLLQHRWWLLGLKHEQNAHCHLLTFAIITRI